jgi:hypothetical protein
MSAHEWVPHTARRRGQTGALPRGATSVSSASPAPSGHPELSTSDRSVLSLRWERGTERWTIPL